MQTSIRLGIGLLLVALAASTAGADTFSHTDAFDHYEGTKTCLACHEKEAQSFFHSQHYQWRGDAPQIVNARGRKLGKLNTINDFCTGPAQNWIGEVKNAKGEVVSTGCSKCHAGSGLMPSEQMSPAQLENIDCLICHAAGYQRNLYEVPGGWAWKPILWKNQEGLDSVSKRLSLPTRAMCLRCHASSGGGPNYKRGDLEYKLADAGPEFDVHMASSGANFQCIECHAGEDHQVRGRGVDLSGTDSPKAPISCDTQACHGAAPHRAAVLNTHAKRVYCTSCHVPTFAREDATDMLRDWSKPVFNEDIGRYSATIVLQKDVTPIYAWYNGRTRATLPGDPVRVGRDGTVAMMAPEGSRLDPKARIFPFKLHRGRMPILKPQNWILPITVEEFFGDGELDRAVVKAADELYHVPAAKFAWVDTVRYMGIFHGVPPASKAVACLGCHGPDSRMDWTALGYARDPIERRAAPARGATRAGRTSRGR